MLATLSRHKKLLALGAGGCLLSLPVVGIVDVDHFATRDDSALTALGAMINSDTFKPPWTPMAPEPTGPEPEIMLKPLPGKFLEQGIAIMLFAWTALTTLWAAICLWNLSLSSIKSTPLLAEPKRPIDEFEPIHSAAGIPAPPLTVVLEESPPSSPATPYATPAASPTSPLKPSACDDAEEADDVDDAEDATQQSAPLRAPPSAEPASGVHNANPAGKREVEWTTRVHIGFNAAGKVELSIDIDEGLIDEDEAKAGEELEELHLPITYPATDLMMMR